MPKNPRRRRALGRSAWKLLSRMLPERFRRTYGSELDELFDRRAGERRKTATELIALLRELPLLWSQELEHRGGEVGQAAFVTQHEAAHIRTDGHASVQHGQYAGVPAEGRVRAQSMVWLIPGQEGRGLTECQWTKVNMDRRLDLTLRIECVGVRAHEHDVDRCGCRAFLL